MTAEVLYPSVGMAVLLPWFAVADWEGLLPQPLQAVRETLRLEAPALYTPVPVYCADADRT